MVQTVAERRILLCRMVSDDLDEAASRKQTRAAETQNQSPPPEKPAGPEPAQNPERVHPTESHEPTDRQLDLLLWKKLNLQEDPESWCQGDGAADADSFPTHLRPFSSKAEYQLVKHTYKQLQHSGYYWGSMTMEEAHHALVRTPPGTFLIRDSGQPDVFFTLSYQSDDGPTSVRVQLNNLLFGLHGSHRTFASLFALLTYYTSSSCKLTAPYRHQRPERLQQMCRRAVMGLCGAGDISSLPGVSTRVKDYVRAYPFCI